MADNHNKTVTQFAMNKSACSTEVQTAKLKTSTGLGSNMFNHIVTTQIKELEEWAYKVGTRAMAALKKSEQECEAASKIKPDNVVISPSGVRSENFTVETYDRKVKTFDTHNNLVSLVDKAFAGGELEIKALENFLDKNFK